MTDVPKSLDEQLATLGSRIDGQLLAHSKPVSGPQPKYESFTAETFKDVHVPEEAYLLYLLWKVVQGSRVVIREIGRAFGVLFNRIFRGRSNPT